MMEGRQHHLRLGRCPASQQGEASSLEAPAIVAVASNCNSKTTLQASLRLSSALMPLSHCYQVDWSKRRAPGSPRPVALITVMARRNEV